MGGLSIIIQTLRFTNPLFWPQLRPWSNKKDRMHWQRDIKLHLKRSGQLGAKEMRHKKEHVVNATKTQRLPQRINWRVSLVLNEIYVVLQVTYSKKKNVC